MNSKVKVLFIGSVCSEIFVSEMIKNKTGSPNLAAQKYHRLLLEGLSKKTNLFKLNVIAIPEYNNGGKNGYIEVSNNVEFLYLNSYNPKFLKFFLNFYQIFILVVKWKLKVRNSPHFIMFDILHFYSAIVSFLVSKILNIKTITTVTDMPECMYILKKKVTILNKLKFKTQNIILKHVNVYIVLTKKTYELFDKKNKHCILIEGLVDSEPKLNQFQNINNNYKIIHYSGGLYEQFGVKMIIEAFMLIDDPNIRFHIYGTGDLESFIVECEKLDNRIVYFGLVENKIVINDQKKSFLLVNPRFSNGIYTHYSFPSKTIEYMASGVPLLTNKLNGIPPKYFDYVFTFDEESIEGYRRTLEKLISTDKNVMKAVGENAQIFIFDSKNNLLQAENLYKILPK